MIDLTSLYVSREKQRVSDRERDVNNKKKRLRACISMWEEEERENSEGGREKSCYQFSVGVRVPITQSRDTASRRLYARIARTDHRFSVPLVLYNNYCLIKICYLTLINCKHNLCLGQKAIHVHVYIFMQTINAWTKQLSTGARAAL